MINDKHTSVLKHDFANEPYPSNDACQKLSEQLGVKKTTVYNMFRSEIERILKAKIQPLPKYKFIYCLFFYNVFTRKLKETVDYINLHD